MQAFATVSDLQTGWKTLSSAEQAVAGELLERATAQLTSIMASHGVEIVPTDEVQAINLKTVTCNMVRRSMCSGDSDGLASASQTIGSTVASVQWANPDGAFYLSRTDKMALGISGGRIGMTPSTLGGDES